MARPHQLVLLDPAHAHARAVVIDADTVERDGTTARFLRLGRTVHVLPDGHVRQIVTHPDQGSARRALDTLQQAKAGAGTREVAEVVAIVPGRRGTHRPRSGAGSAVAESVHAVVSGERIAHVPKRRR